MGTSMGSSKDSIIQESDEINNNMILTNKSINPVYNKLSDQVSYIVHTQVWDQVSNKVWYPVYNQVSNQVRHQLWKQLSNQVSNQVWDQLWDQVYRNLRK